MTLPRVSISITSYKPSARPYLDLCIESIKNLDYPKELLDVVVVAPGTYARNLAASANGDYGVCSPGEEYGMPKGLNEGITWASSESEYFFVLNDDVILTSQCLKKLVAHAEDPRIGLLMPIGNDQQGKYGAFVNPGGHYLDAGPYRLEQAKNPLLKHAHSIYPPALIFADTLCLYAFLMHRRVWDKVGPFDENLIGQDDIDYSMRTRHAGFMNAIALDSLVWHAGGASNTLTDEQRAKSFEIFNKKWGLG